MKKPTIKDVARFTGVSVGTVSRVLNNQQGVRPYTREKVLKAMKELNYQPEVAARELSSRGGAVIGLHLRSGSLLYNKFYINFIEHLTEGAISKGYRFNKNSIGR